MTAEEEPFRAGERTNSEGKPIANRILLELPEPEFQAVRPLLTFVQFPHHASLHEPGEKLEFVYFPNHGLVSTVVVMKDGRTVEVGVAGNEGLVGTLATVRLSRSPHRVIVQIVGNAHRIRVDALRPVLAAAPQLQFVAGRHAVIQVCRQRSRRRVTGFMASSNGWRGGCPSCKITWTKGGFASRTIFWRPCWALIGRELA